MRVTFGTGLEAAVSALNKAATQLNYWEDVVASGKRVTTPSDDPSSAAAGVRDQAEKDAIDRYQASTDNASSRLNVLDTVLSDMVSTLTSAQSKTAGAIGTTQTDAEREATAQALEGLRDQLLDDINASFGGTYLFSGTSSLTPPYAQAEDGTVSAYKGNADTMSVDIGANRTAQVSYSGLTLTQGSSSEDVFTTLQNLIAAVRANDQDAINAGMTSLATAFDRVVSVQTGVGADMNQLESQTSRLSTMETQAKAELSKDLDANMADAATQMSQANTVYEAALKAVSTRSKLSLMDYLS